LRSASISDICLFLVILSNLLVILSEAKDLLFELRDSRSFASLRMTTIRSG